MAPNAEASAKRKFGDHASSDSDIDDEALMAACLTVEEMAKVRQLQNQDERENVAVSPNVPNTDPAAAIKQPRIEINQKPSVSIEASGQQAAIPSSTHAFVPVAAAKSTQAQMMNQFFSVKKSNALEIRMKSRNLQVLCCGPGASIEDQGSSFTAHVAFRCGGAPLTTEDVEDARRFLRSDGNIAEATHPTIYAFMTKFDNHKPTIVGDDDGETGAAETIKKVLTRRRCEHVAIFVTRWFGGVMLGGKRFKHIEVVANAAVTCHGLGNRLL